MTVPGGALATEAVPAPPLLEIIVPVHDEAAVLAASIGRLTRHLATGFPFTWRVTIVDNASTDGTWTEASKLAALHDQVDALRLEAKGRGRALRAAWSRSDAMVVAYMDVDLSTDLRALLPLIAPLVSGHSDVTIGSRLAAGARVVRGPRRELVSRTYNRLLRVVFRNRFRDAQCGFKALRTELAQRLLPWVADEAWFFDTELLLLAERNGFRITEIPVDWVDDPDSRVDVVRTALDDLRGIRRVAFAFWTGRTDRDVDADLAGLERRPPPAGTGGELVAFATVGAVSTVAYFVLFLALRDVLGDLWANAVALTATMVANTGAHRAWTFGRRAAAAGRGGRWGRWREWARATTVHVAGLALTTAAIVAARAVDGATTTSLVVLLPIASVLSTALRFLLMPAWIFRKAEPGWPPTPPPTPRTAPTPPRTPPMSPTPPM
jgi:putative flippase GtrA